MNFKRKSRKRRRKAGRVHSPARYDREQGSESPMPSRRTVKQRLARLVSSGNEYSRSSALEINVVRG
jgi:hypothetical protein